MIELAKEHNIPELLDLAEQTRRRRPVRKAPYKMSPALTPDERQEIRDYVEANPELSYQEIAARFSVGIGRISEVMAGRR